MVVSNILESTPRVPAHGWQMNPCDEECQCLSMMTFWIKSKGGSRFVTVHKLVDCQGSALCGMVILCEEEFFAKAFFARGVWPNLQAQDQKESSALQPEFILKCQSYFLLPVISVECCRALDHVGGFRFMDEELMPVVLFGEDTQGCGNAAEEGGRWAGIRRNVGM